MSERRYTPEEIAERGDAIYEQRIRARVAPHEHGKFVVIDIDTGDYEVDLDDLAATKRMLARRPDAVTYGVRIGHPTAYRIGRVSRQS